jgi:hypothetical protein
VWIVQFVASSCLPKRITSFCSRLVNIYIITSELLFFFTISVSGILNTRKHTVSETGFVSVFGGRGRVETPALWGRLERANLSHFLRDPTEYVSPSSNLRTETDPVSETLWFLVFKIRTVDKFQKTNNSECHAPSSEPFRFYPVTCHVKRG